ncbi:DNA-binding transcriptional regulator, Lrp family [Saccharopolyspora antimicrobica]|uniref:AsnC family transcriptional regulator n=1 Tax=Saccharopolyspora antimicrobica TaxID=455193 RepID=A0A1I5EJX0_9PSEU|nr:AsnC family transcriptional regulator [Saccharopolyspora antimicrobica]SFO11690.1 DNA-binding transcriptional regulator, Lrp family [Saccharopolyspora antimicrobica]
MLDDLDLDLVSALQEAPRAPINALAEAVGSSPSTVGRRLQRLHAERLLRVIGQLDWTLISETHPRHVWITTAPGRLQDVARKLAELPEAQYVAMTTGRADVYCTVRPLGRDAVKDLLTQRIPSVPGVVSTQSDLVLKPFGRAEAWRVDRLAEAQLAVLAPHRIDPQEAVEPQSLSEQEREATRLLHADARLTSSDLSRALGVSQSTAHRLIAGLLERQVVRPRVEVEPALLGFPLEVALSLSTEPGSTEAVGRALGRHPSARYVSMVAGNATVIHQGVFRGEEHLADFLSADLAALPGIRSVEVSVVLDVLRRYWITRTGPRLGEADLPLRFFQPQRA